MEHARRIGRSSLPAGAALVVAAAAGATVARASSPLLVAAALLGVALVALAFREPIGAIAVFVAATFVEQVPAAGSGVTLAKGLGALVVLIWIVGVLRGRFRVEPLAGARGVLVAAAAGLFVWSVASATWASDSSAALHSALRLGQGVVLLAVLVSALCERRALRLATIAFVAGATLSGLLGIAGVGATSATATSGTRIGGGLADPNYLAAVLAPGIVFALALRATTRNRLARLTLLAVAVLMAFALLRTESRGGVVALAACAAVGLVFGGRLRRTIAVSAVTLVAGAAIYLASAPSSAHRILSFGGGGSGRTELWTIALQAFRLHPLGGIGLGNFTVREPAYAVTTMANLTKPYQEVTTLEVVHNTYLHIAAELGIVGLLLLLVLVVGSLVLGLRAAGALALADDRDAAVLVRGLVVGSAGMFTAFVFLTAQYEKQLWVALGLLGAASALARTARSQ